MSLAVPRPDAPDRRLYPVAAAADALGISKSKLYQEITAGRIASVLIGTKRLIAARELDRYVESLSDA